MSMTYYEHEHRRKNASGVLSQNVTVLLQNMTVITNCVGTDI